ncbi:MAG: BON domain-containing protein [Candidatus Hydrogenedentes bacterium]|nr:BON domain-containing protein [Candidatus Hydrogenedentota bacterium]
MRHALMTIALCAASAVAQQTTTEAVSEAVTDTAISARIETLFAINESLSPFNINTTTIGGVVTLTGSVGDEIAKDLATSLAKTVDGVKEVDNQLTVVDDPIPPRPQKTWRERINDASLAAAIRSNLVYNKEFKGFKIGVDCDGGDATIYGVVGNEFSRDRIGQIVMDTRGVEKVTNNLTVHASPSTNPINTVTREVTDEVVEKRVQASIALNRYVSIRGLNVKVDDGVCILTGFVETAKQRELAESIAANIAGVVRVQNDLKLYEPPPLLPPPQP